jgi:hypothetical protein
MNCNQLKNMCSCTDLGTPAVGDTQPSTSLQIYLNHLDIRRYYLARCSTLLHYYIYGAGSSLGTSGSTFQILSAYSSMHLSLVKKPMRATVRMLLVVHSSVFL